MLTKKDNSIWICLPWTVVGNSAACGCEPSVILFLSASIRPQKTNKINSVMLKKTEFKIGVSCGYLLPIIFLKFIKIEKLLTLEHNPIKMY